MNKSQTEAREKNSQITAKRREIEMLKERRENDAWHLRNAKEELKYLLDSFNPPNK